METATGRSIGARRWVLTANGLTLGRLALGLAAGVLLGLGWGARTAALLCLLASATDSLDGLLARRLEQETALGAWLDPITDKVVVLVLFAWVGKLVAFPHYWSFYAALAAREVGMTLLRVLGSKKWGLTFATNRLGKAKMVAEGFVGNAFFLVLVFPIPLGGIPHWAMSSGLILVLALAYFSAALSLARR